MVGVTRESRGSECMYILTDSRRHGARSRRSRGRGCWPHPLRIWCARSWSSGTVITVTAAQVLQQTNIILIINFNHVLQYTTPHSNVNTKLYVLKLPLTPRIFYDPITTLDIINEPT